MLIEILLIIVRFILLVTLQVVVLDNVQLSYFINPYLYVLFILLLPINMPRGLVLIIALILGFVVGAPTNTSGIHGAACVFIGYMRPFVLKLIAPREGYESDAKPTMREMGLNWFFSYAAIMVFLHHTFLFFLEVFRFSEFFTTIMRIVVSSLFTLAFIKISVYLFYKPKGQR